jgi:hypothetical protein
VKQPLAALIFLLALLGARDGHACKPALPPQHLSDETRRSTDKQAPRFISPPTLTVQRGARSGGCETPASGDCSDIGRIRIKLPVLDDQTPAAECGFRLALVSGELPIGLPGHDMRTFSDGEIVLPFPELSTEESLSFTLSVTPIDAAANLGETVTLSYATDDGGCAVGGGRPGTWLLVALLLFWWGLRRLTRSRATVSGTGWRGGR